MIRDLVERFTRRGKVPGWLVVEVGERTVSLAHVRTDGELPVVEFAEEREWDPQEPKSLERVAREFGARRYRCTTLLRPQEYQILLVEAPAVRAEELRAAVRWRVKDMLDFRLDDATIDVLDVPQPAASAQRARSVYAVAARNATIRATIDRFETAGFPLQVIDIPETAQRNIGARLESEQRAVITLSFDAYGGLVTVNHGGELYLSRRLEITDAQLADALEEARARLFDRVLLEVQRSLDHCERSYSFFSLGRLLLSPPGDQAGLRDHLAANLYLPVESLMLEEVVRLPARAGGWAPREHAKWQRSIGAGLRMEGGAA